MNKHKKDKKMPTDYTTMTTDDLIALLATTPKGQTFNAILTEITHAEREIEDDDENVPAEYRGGIRPTRPSL